MNKLELQKTANEIRRVLLQPYILQKRVIPADPYPQQTYLLTYILKR